MTTPDWSSYVDLTIYDEDADAIFDAAIEEARSSLPDWIPYPGNIEVVLLEAIATEASNVIAAANRVPGATTETLLKLFGVERDDGQRATATLAITLTSTSGYTIPTGTSFAFFPPDQTAALVYESTADLIIPNGSNSGNVAVRASVAGSAHNDPNAGDALQILETVPYVESVTFSVAPSGGSDAESDLEFFQRAINTLQSYSAAMSTSSQVRSYVLTNHNPPAFRCQVYNSAVASDRDTTAAGYIEENYPGRLLVVVASSNSDPSDLTDVPLDITELETIEADVASRVNSSLLVDVVGAELVDVAVSVTVKKESGYLDQTVEDNIENALDNYLSLNVWDWDQAVRVNELIGMITHVAGVSYVVSLDNITTTSPNASNSGAGTDLDLHLLGSLTYPDASNYTITVT